MIDNYSVVVVPGLGGSGPDHWQTRWEQLNSEFIRCEQDDWQIPLPQTWIPRLEQTAAQCEKPLIIVAHSMGCITTVKWLATTKCSVAGVFLVAPADVDHEECLAVLKPFAPIPVDKLLVPSVVVASENDPYMSLERAETFSRLWGSSCVNMGAVGHINADSDLGEWPEGHKIFDQFIQSL